MRRPVVKVQWQGIEELKNTLAQVGLSLDDRDRTVKNVIMGPATKMRDEARELAPVKTGNLRASIYANPGGDRQRGVLMGVNAKKAYYGRFVEYGTSKMMARPYFRPALLKMTGSYANDITPGIKKIIEDTAEKNAYHPPD